MIEVWYTPGGTATAVWGPRVAVLADLGSDHALPAELTDLVKNPNVGSAQVIDLLTSPHRPAVGDFSLVEELARNLIRVVLRGRGACRIDGEGMQGRGMWRSRVVSARQIELLSPVAPPAPNQQRQGVGPVRASALTVSLAGGSAPGGPRRALLPTQ